MHTALRCSFNSKRLSARAEWTDAQGRLIAPSSVVVENVRCRQMEEEN